jgi:periplasmic protein TonB
MIAAILRWLPVSLALHVAALGATLLLPRASVLPPLFVDLTLKETSAGRDDTTAGERAAVAQAKPSRASAPAPGRPATTAAAPRLAPPVTTPAAPRLAPPATTPAAPVHPPPATTPPGPQPVPPATTASVLPEPAAPAPVATPPAPLAVSPRSDTDGDSTGVTSASTDHVSTGSAAAVAEGGAGSSSSGAHAGDGGSGGGRGTAGGGDALALAISGDDGGAYAGYIARLRRRVQEALTYPSAARRRGMSGTVHLDISVEPTGKIADVLVVRSSSHDMLDAAALDAVRAVRRVPFPPGVRPRAVRVRLPVVFELR